MYQGYGSSLPPPPQQQQAQSPTYGQAPHWSPAPGQVHYGQTSAAPLPDVYADPNAFAQMYKSHLAALTFNSKPIITNLTVMAHENVSRMANVIAQCLDEHILQSHPSYRLPAMYVLDSISKNIGSPYVSLWGQRIAHIFLETYRLVDQQTKVRMEELLNTWRTAGQAGQPLFGGEAQWEIERNLYGNQGPPQTHLSPPKNFTHLRASPRPGTRSPLLSNGQAVPTAGDESHRTRMVEQIDRLLALGTQEQYRSPQAFNPSRMAALKQLKTVVLSQNLSAQENEQIQNQLNTLAQEYQQAAGDGSTPTMASATPSLMHQSSAVPSLPANIGSALDSLTKMGVLGSNSRSTPQPSSATPSHQSAVPFSNANPSEDLIKSLMAAGLLPASSNSGSSKPAGQDDAYSSAILALDIKLSSADLQKDLSQQAVDLVCHRHLPLQCRQCANRYPSCPSGQRSLEKHIDWHFKQGRKAKESLARGHSRSWLEKVFDWVRGGVHDPSVSGKAGAETADSKKGLSAQQEAELKAASDAWVAAPTEASLANAPCPICKEKFQSEWSEDEEEWIWKNARKVDSQYYHGSCYYSAKILSTTVSNRTTTPPGRRSSDRKSRTATPPSRRTPANPVERIKAEDGTDALVGRKRKESPADLANVEEDTQEPQSKKIAA
ncbi:unnamed protein product [Sympodiomycopsis kandeliae]